MDLGWELFISAMDLDLDFVDFTQTPTRSWTLEAGQCTCELGLAVPRLNRDNPPHMVLVAAKIHDEG